MYTTLESAESLQVLEPIALILTYQRAARTIPFALKDL